MGQLRHCTRCTYLGCNGGFIGHYSFIVWLFWHRHGYKAQKRRVWAWLTKIDLSKVEDIELDGINTRDYPDFCDAFISGATYKGRAYE
jgi:ABC-type transport system involved in cytochrome c biogenesis ATPase subunit